jgi:hypothetical protein
MAIGTPIFFFKKNFYKKQKLGAIWEVWDKIGQITKIWNPDFFKKKIYKI